jgi:predicted metal-dependent HD superfamily phosphohydrolase
MLVLLMIRDKLYNRWTNFCAEIGAINQFSVDTVFEWIELAYTEPNRQYHTLSHLNQCFEELDQTNWTPAIEFALWFHDIVYDPSQFNNEEESVKIAINAMGLLQISQRCPERVLVPQMILATKSHKRTSDIEDLNLFLDIDLSILGQKSEIFDQYEKQIRKEYEFVPHEMFNLGRKSILNSFLAEKEIFYTPNMKKYETQARENIQRSLNSLV